MDPKFNPEWSATEIEMMKSLVATHNANTNNADDTNRKHNDIVNDLQAWFPLKEKRQVVELYVELLVEMTQPIQIENEPMVEDYNTKFWTIEEHRQFLRGLHVYGWGNWMNIAEHFVTTKTPVQILSHAQKYVRSSLERAYEKQRQKINHVRLWDVEPSPGNNSFSAGQASSSQGHLD